MRISPAHHLAGIALLLAAFAASCELRDAPGPGRGAGAAKGDHRPPVAVALAPVRTGSAWRTIDVTGTIFGEEEATIASKLSGRIEAVAADVGDRAPSGTVLARIEARDFELALAEAEAALRSSLARLGLSELPAADPDLETLPAVRRARAEGANAAARLERATQLFQATPPLLSAQDYADIRTMSDVARETAEAEVLAAASLLAEARARQAAIAVARQRLADTVIVAPGSAATAPEGGNSRVVTYHVARRLVSLGEYVMAGQAMFRLVATEQVDFRARVAERFAGQVQPGQHARVWVEAYAQPATGQVTRVAPQVDSASRTFLVEVRIDNREGRLKPGAFARGEIGLREEADVTFVPAAAVATFAGVMRVFSVEDGKAREHRVQLGVRVGDDVEIVGGLGADHVVVSGAAALAHDVPVTVGAP